MTPSSASAYAFDAILREGDVVAWPQATGEPRGLTTRLVAQRHALPPIALFIGMTTSRTLTPEVADRFRITGLNGAGDSRRLTAAGVLDIVPAHVGSVPALLRAGALRVDVALIRVRPHTRPGYYSTGVIADYTQALIAHARVVVAEIDERLPRTGDDALVRAEDIDAFVIADNDEILLADPEPSAIDLRVAAQVAAMIPDGATLQLGIGGLPVAVGRALAHHRELGLHSGVVSDIAVDLIEAGVVTNARKGADAGRTVTGGLFGGRRLIDFAHDNDAVSLRSVEYTHNASAMATVSRLHAINGAIEVDLTGQVNSEVAAGRYLGAIGGQVSFVRGAWASPGGRAIMALPATTADGAHSRIVATLAGPVTTARADVDLVVTEHGVADLRGCSLSERARRLVAVADPKFRDALARA